MTEQRPHSASDVIPDRPNFMHGLALGIAKWPVFSAQTGDVWALVATSHGDEEPRVSRQLFSQLLWPCVAKINSYLLHRC